ELELERAELEAVRRDQRRGEHVVDRVDLARPRALELQEAVPPVEGTQAERQLVVAQDLRRVDRQVAARIDRRPEPAEIDAARELGVRRRGRERDTEDDD